MIADEARAVLEREFPDRRVAETTPARRGNTKETTLVRFADGAGVVVQSAADAEAFRAELALARAVGERTRVPTPDIRAAGSLDGRAYAVVEWVDGTDLHERFARVDDETRRRLSRRFGRFLADLHGSFAFEGYGAVRADDADSEGDGLRVTDGASSWPAWFESYAREGVDALPSAFDGMREDLRAAVAGADVPADPTPRLYPWDLRPGNAVFDDGSGGGGESSGEGGGGDVAAVLDWGGPLAAAPGLAAAKVEHLVADWYVADGAPLRAAFREGYRSVRPYPAVPRVYRLVAAVRSAVDSRGDVTRPRYPEEEGEAAVRFHRDRMREWL